MLTGVSKRHISQLKRGVGVPYKPCQSIVRSCANLNQLSNQPTTATYRFFSKSSINMSTKPSPYKAKVKSVEKLDQGNWIQTRRINYTDPNGSNRVWEMAIRTTRTETTNIDAVSIAALISYPDKPKEIVLTKQFRPPCGSVVIELPAGLIDPKESVESTAIRELIEETGYHGKFISLSETQVSLFSDPGLTNANMSLAFVDVDINDERNKNPTPELEDGEFIEIFTLPINQLLKGLLEVTQKEGCVVDARLYHFAAGIDLAFANKDILTN